MQGQVTSAVTEDAQGAPRVAVHNVTVTYGAKVVIRDASLTVGSRETVCLIGASGCGKTTLLHVIAGLLAPTDGTIEIDGRPVAGPGAGRAMVFQEDAVFPWMTVEKNVEYGLRVRRVSTEARKAAVKKALDMVGLAGSERLLPRELSGGMRKRVDLARAIAIEPEILLMDEPYAALDMMTKERLQVEFAAVSAALNTTVVFVTHDLEEAIYLGDRVIVMSTNPGRLQSELPVPFARPRALDLKRSADFQALRGYLTERLAEAGADTIERPARIHATTAEGLEE